jgi:hypothetical protein
MFHARLSLALPPGTGLPPLCHCVSVQAVVSCRLHRLEIIGSHWQSLTITAYSPTKKQWDHRLGLRATGALAPFFLSFFLFSFFSFFHALSVAIDLFLPKVSAPTDTTGSVFNWASYVVRKVSVRTTDTNTNNGNYPIRADHVLEVAHSRALGLNSNKWWKPSVSRTLLVSLCGLQDSFHAADDNQTLVRTCSYVHISLYLFLRFLAEMARSQPEFLFLFSIPKVNAPKPSAAVSAA